MNQYIPTGNEMISLPKINEDTAGIEDFTYLSMQHKGLIEVRGSENTPLIQPFVVIDGEATPLTELIWNREHDWIPSVTAKAGTLNFSMVILPPIGERGFRHRCGRCRNNLGSERLLGKQLALHQRG